MMWFDPVKWLDDLYTQHQVVVGASGNVGGVVGASVAVDRHLEALHLLSQQRSQRKQPSVPTVDYLRAGEYEIVGQARR